LKFEAILFDFDGVLADTEPIHWHCWSETLAPFGITLDWEIYCRQCIGVSDREMIASLCRLAPNPIDFERVWAQYPVKKQRFRDRVETTPPIAAATIELLSSLAGYKLAVVSSSGRVEIEPVLIRAGIRDRFDALVCGEDVKALKPAPDPYLKAAELLRVRSALVVEDSDAGIESARRAGFESLRIGRPVDLPALLKRRLEDQARA
jgi:HAD superfamily hydrolase (TIGR01509 family)